MKGKKAKQTQFPPFKIYHIIGEKDDKKMIDKDHNKYKYKRTTFKRHTFSNRVKSN